MANFGMSGHLTGCVLLHCLATECVLRSARAYIWQVGRPRWRPFKRKGLKSDKKEWKAKVTDMANSGMSDHLTGCVLLHCLATECVLSSARAYIWQVGSPRCEDLLREKVWRVRRNNGKQRDCDMANFGRSDHLTRCVLLHCLATECVLSSARAYIWQVGSPRWRPFKRKGLKSEKK